MSEEIAEEINKVARMIYEGAIGERFDFIIEQLGRIAVDERITNEIHKTINPMLDDMICQLNSMKNNVIACMVGRDDTPMKVVQPTDVDLKSCPCCGSSRIHVIAPDNGCYCWDCGLTMPNRKDWRARWNRRVNE